MMKLRRGDEHGYGMCLQCRSKDILTIECIKIEPFRPEFKKRWWGSHGNLEKNNRTSNGKSVKAGLNQDGSPKSDMNGGILSGLILVRELTA